MRVQIDRPIGHSRTDGLLWHWIVATTARARPAAVGTTRAGETAREESCCSPRSSREVHCRPGCSPAAARAELTDALKRRLSHEPIDLVTELGDEPTPGVSHHLPPLHSLHTHRRPSYV
jgi:hypothetical protein